MSNEQPQREQREQNGGQQGHTETGTGPRHRN